MILFWDWGTMAAQHITGVSYNGSTGVSPVARERRVSPEPIVSMYYVYLLQLDEKGNKQYYIGYTADLRQRVAQHKQGNTRTTKQRNPKLIYYEAFVDKYMAIQREKRLKQSGSVYNALLRRLGLKD